MNQPRPPYRGKTAVPTPQPLLRHMLERDLAEVLDHEFESFEDPWREADFRGCLRQRNNLGMVMAIGDRVAGYMVYALEAECLFLLNIAVGHEFRRRGLGRQMVDRLKGKLSEQRRTRLEAEVQDSNLLGQLFFKSQGFVVRKVLRDHYDDLDGDAYLFRFDIRQHAGVRP